MKNIKVDLLLIILSVVLTIWSQSHVSALPVLMGLGLIPLFGSVIATPRKRARRSAR
jgi:hypothetical protein